MRKLIVSAFAAAALLGSGFVAADDASGNYYGKAIIKLDAEVKERCHFTKGSIRQKLHFGKYDYKHGNVVNTNVKVRCKAEKRRKGASFTIQAGSLFTKDSGLALKQKHGVRKLAVMPFCDGSVFNVGQQRTETTNMKGERVLPLRFELKKGQHVPAGKYWGEYVLTFAH